MKAEWPKDTMPELPLKTANASTAATCISVRVAMLMPVFPNAAQTSTVRTAMQPMRIAALDHDLAVAPPNRGIAVFPK
jgi:hypothetical protein